MITYDVHLCIGTDNPNKRLAVKCHDTGVNLRTHMQVCSPGKWKDTYEPYIIPIGTTAVIRITKPDKKYCITDGNIENNYALFEMKPQAFTAPGICSAEVSLFGPDGKRITSGTFYIDVPEECICGCDLESENYIDVMSEQIRAAIDAADRAETAASHGPIIQDGTWWLWDTVKGAYVDSGVKASGESGITEAEAKQIQTNKENIEKLDTSKLDASKLPEAVNDALAQAKASGEFKGDPGKDGVDGQPGKDGYTPVKGVDYFDGQPGEKGEKGEPGYTPQKGIDYFDGADGKDGRDGYTPVKGKDYFDGQPGADGKPGVDGKDGTSATHSWNGTVLTITSASGTSSADLKGADGKPGEDGYTPQKGVDYFDGEPGQPGRDGQDGNPGKDGVDGQPGKDGISPVVAVSAITGGHRITITDANGTKTVDVMDGSDGKDGSNGSDGTSVTVKSVSESTADGGSNVVTFSDGKTLTVKNGKTGETGPQGEQGIQGPQGIQGEQGIPGEKGDKGDQGDQGPKGDKGDTGPQGEPGKDAPKESVLFIPQNLSEQQKEQARDNIGAVTPHIGNNGNWYIGDTDTGKPSVLTASGKTQYAKKSNITDGQFWLLSSGNVIKYTYANYSTLEPLTLPAGQYCISALSAPYSFVKVGTGAPQKIADFEPGASVSEGSFVITLTETTTLYLGYYTPTQVTNTLPYVVSGTEPLAAGEYFEGEDTLSLEKLLNYGAFVESYIKNCELVANELDVSGSTQGHYNGVKMGANIEKIMCKARLVDNASVALITTNRGSSVVTDITGGSLHLVFSLGNCAVGIFDTAGNLRSVTNYPYTVAENAEVSFGFSVNESTNTLTVYLPDGTTKTVTDNDVSIRNGQYAIWEHFCNVSVAGFECCRITKLWCKDKNGEVLDDNLKRLDGAIGVAPTGQVYRQFTTHNLYNHDFI